MADKTSLEKNYPATTDGFAAATADLDDYCINPRISIVFDELASNVVRCSGANSFTLKVCQDGDGAISMELSDDGKEFDPTRTADPNIGAAVEDREIGGLGLFMVRKMAKSFSYVREGGLNIVRVTM